MPRASLNLIIKIIVFEKLAGQLSPVRTPSLEQRPETLELKLLGTGYGNTQSPQETAIISDVVRLLGHPWYTLAIVFDVPWASFWCFLPS